MAVQFDELRDKWGTVIFASFISLSGLVATVHDLLSGLLIPFFSFLPAVFHQLAVKNQQLSERLEALERRIQAER